MSNNNLGPVAPNQLNYSDILPIAIESRSQKRTFNPTNGEIFGPDQTNVIRLNINSDNLWDCTHSFLQVRLTNTSTGGNAQQRSCGLDQGLPWLNRLQIMSGGVELENIDAYNRLYALMLQIQGNPEQRHDLTLSHAEKNCQVNKIAVGAGDLGGVQAADIAAALNVVSDHVVEQTGFYHNEAGTADTKIEAFADTPAESFVIYNVPLMSAILNNPKYFPLIFTNMGLDINLYLEDAVNVMCVDNAATPNYQISDVRYHCHLVDVDKTFYDRMRSAMMASGGFLQLAGTTYRHYLDTKDDGSIHTLQISTRLKSLNALFVRPQLESNSNDKDAYCLSVGASCGANTYQFRIGSMVYPQQAVKVSEGDGTSTHLVGEAYSELRKCLGVLGTYDHNSWINADTFKIGAPSTNVSLGLREMAVLAYNFEGFAKTATESGINVADRALNVTCEIHRDSTGGGLGGARIRYDIFAQTDMIIYISANGEISTTI
eukprot:SAG11_NODE_2250_length_3633_cov_129.866440_2_plen_488_part_00